MIEGKAIRRMRGKCRIAIVGRGKEIKFNTRTLHQSREGMRHPKACERIEGRPPARPEAFCGASVSRLRCEEPGVRGSAFHPALQHRSYFLAPHLCTATVPLT